MIITLGTIFKMHGTWALPSIYNTAIHNLKKVLVTAIEIDAYNWHYV